MRQILIHIVLALFAFAFAQTCASAQTPQRKNEHDTTRASPPKPAAAKKKRAARAPTLAQLEAQRKTAAKSAIRSGVPSISSNTPIVNRNDRSAASRNAALSYVPASAPLPPNIGAARARGATIATSTLSPNAVSPRSETLSYATAPRASVVLLAPTSIDANVLTNLHEPLIAPAIEMGDRPARGTSLCSDGRLRRFGEIDMKAFAQTLPDFNVARPRTVCVRRGVLMADYGFK